MFTCVLKNEKSVAIICKDLFLKMHISRSSQVLNMNWGQVWALTPVFPCFPCVLKAHGCRSLRNSSTERVPCAPPTSPGCLHPSPSYCSVGVRWQPLGEPRPLLPLGGLWWVTEAKPTPFHPGSRPRLATGDEARGPGEAALFSSAPRGWPQGAAQTQTQAGTHPGMLDINEEHSRTCFITSPEDACACLAAHVIMLPEGELVFIVSPPRPPFRLSHLQASCAEAQWMPFSSVL